MSFNPKVLAGMAFAALLAQASPAAADFPTYYSDAGLFAGQGTIFSTTHFDAFPTGLTVLSDNETFGPITASGGQLIVVGAQSYLNPVRNLIANNLPSDFLVLDIQPTNANMLAFSAGNLIEFDQQVFLQIETNLDTYFYGLYPQPAPEALSFYGFVVPLGEYFTGMKFSHTSEDQSFGLTDIQLGTTGLVCENRICSPVCDRIGGCDPGAIPEPSTWALLILGFGAVGAAIRSRRFRRLSPA